MKTTRLLAVLGMTVPVLFACTSPGDTPVTSRSDIETGPAVVTPEPDTETGPAVVTPEPGDRKILFGNLHSHTNLSFDSYVGWNDNTQDDAYNFAKGGEGLPLVEQYNGDGDPDYEPQTQPALKVPLDFAAITDHAEWFGELDACLDPNSGVFNDPFCEDTQARIAETFTGWSDPDVKAVKGEGLLELAIDDPPDGAQHHPICDVANPDCLARTEGTWKDIQEIANDHNEEGVFTTLIAYEYTGSIEDFGMLHRNVFFRNDNVIEPIDAIEEPDAGQLWQRLKDECNEKEPIDGKAPCEALAIAHSPNYSWGQMLDPDLANPEVKNGYDPALRAEMEPLIEIFQTKGGSECYDGLGSTDELCDFEQLWDPCSETGTSTFCVDERAFVRNALKEGLAIEQKRGANPFKFGIVAAMDTHNGIEGATEEDEYRGHHGNTDVTAEMRLGLITGNDVESTENTLNNPAGLTGVVADANSRDAIFDALKRKETFGTSGTRITVRFFGSFVFPPGILDMGNPIETAYAVGVPMGGDLLAMGSGPPSFLVWATGDVNSAKLQRVQIVKGSYDGTSTNETVYDVICSNGQPPVPWGSDCPKAVPLSSAEVDLGSCAAAKAGGQASDFSTLWTDQEFDPTDRAFYYVRVLEEPTCRWSTWDALRLARDDPDEYPEPPFVEDLPVSIQERAWSSPIWYTPGS